MFSDLLILPSWVLNTAVILVSVAMLCAGWRVWKGPSIADRIVALDLLGSLLMAQFVLLAFSSQFLNYLDVAAVIAIVSFLATVAFARYLEQQDSDL